MEKTTTAGEFLQDSLEISHFFSDQHGATVCFSTDVQKAMIAFAKLKVEEALKEASEKALVEAEPETGTVKYKKQFEVGPENGVKVDYVFSVDKTSILNAYPLTNII